MARPKTKSLHPEPSTSLSSVPASSILPGMYPGVTTSASELRNYLVGIQDILLSIVDALYDKDGDAATWKPIRDKIEGL